MMAYRSLFNALSKRSSLFYEKSLLNIKTQFNCHASQSMIQPKSSTLLPMKKILAAVCCFGVTGGAYAYLTAVPQRNNRNISHLIDYSDFYVLSKEPDSKPSRQVAGPATQLGLNVLLYQYQSCPFCCKVRAFLDYYGIPYDIVEVNPIMKQQLKFSNYKKVPILVVHDRKADVKHQLNDSSVIVSILGTFLLNAHEKLQDILKLYVPVSYTNDEGKEVVEVMNQYFLMYGETAQKGRSDEDLCEERKWRKWADQELVHVLSPNIYRTLEEALQAFKHFSKVGEWEKNFSAFERLTAIYVGATAMYFIGKKLKKKYGINDDVRESLYDSCRVWVKSIGKSKFQGGASPNLADLAVYGLLSSIEGCTAFQDLLEHTNIGPWFYNMKDATNKHLGFKEIHSKNVS